MKTKILLLLAVVTAILLGSASTYSQTGCPPDPAIQVEGSTNCIWNLNITTLFTMQMPNGSECECALIFCER